MRGRIFLTLLGLLLVALLVIAPWAPMVAQESAAQLRFIKHGVQTQGFGVQQVGMLGTLSAAVASATLTEVVAAPASGSTVIVGVWVEKATASTGNVLVRYGTGTNCATGTTTLLSIGVGSPAIGFYPVYALAPAGKAVCLGTDAGTTSARVLYQ
jgi:hypothetical protein